MYSGTLMGYEKKDMVRRKHEIWKKIIVLGLEKRAGPDIWDALNLTCHHIIQKVVLLENKGLSKIKSVKIY